MNDAIIPILTALGFGGIIGAYFQSLFQHRGQLKEKEHELKSKRYKAILILMLTKLDPESGLRKIAEFRDDLKSIQDVEKEIETELMNSILFANDDVIKNLSAFCRDSTNANYIGTALAMRKDLWGRKTKVKEDWLEGLNVEMKTRNI